MKDYNPNYKIYSKKRKSIQQQVKRLNKKGFNVAPSYMNLPTVKELKAMSADDRRRAVKRVKSYTTQQINKSASRIAENSYDLKRDKYVQRKQTYAEYLKGIRSQAGKTGGVVTQAKKKKLKKKLKRENMRSKLEAAKESVPDYGGVYDEWEEQYLSGETDKSYPEYVASIPEAPSVEDMFYNLVGFLSSTDPQTYNEIVKGFLKASKADKKGLMERLRTSELPDFDIFYDDKGNQGTVNKGKVYKLLKIIKGSPLTAYESQALMKAIEKDRLD